MGAKYGDGNHQTIRKIKFMIFIRGRRSLMISCAMHYV